MYHINHASVSTATMPVLPSTLFSYHLEGHIMTVEESTLRGNCGRWYGQAFNDACDEGFGIRSEKSGKVVYFVKDSTDERDGEEMGWRYKPFKGQDVVGEDTFEVLVIND
jgi:hypothetical protein